MSITPPSGGWDGVELFGVHLAGLSPSTAHKLVLSAAFVVVLYGLSYGLRLLIHLAFNAAAGGRPAFWSRQVVKIATAVILVIGGVSIWFEDPAQLATAAGLITAGLAVALQRVITSFAAYFIVLRGRIYTVGDRITVGGVRGDVLALGFMQTTVMEMGEGPGAQDAAPGSWIKARQYTGRLVRITNDKIFDSPVYNYTQEFPFFWEELHLPVKYGDDRDRVERILLDAASRHTAPYADDVAKARDHLKAAYPLPDVVGIEPTVYYRLTDNWLELSVRFVVPERGVRGIKDAISRDILRGLEDAGIGLASGTYEIVGLPPVRVTLEGRDDVHA